MKQFTSPRCKACGSFAYQMDSLPSPVGFNKDIFHIKCFKCNECAIRLNISTYKMISSQPYCKNCFIKVSANRKHTSFSSKNKTSNEILCFVCNEKISIQQNIESFINEYVLENDNINNTENQKSFLIVDNLKFHRKCFQCLDCKTILNCSNGFVVKNEKCFCLQCNEAKFKIVTEDVKENISNNEEKTNFNFSDDVIVNINKNIENILEKLGSLDIKVKNLDSKVNLVKMGVESSCKVSEFFGDEKDFVIENNDLSKDNLIIEQESVQNVNKGKAPMLPPKKKKNFA